MFNAVTANLFAENVHLVLSSAMIWMFAFVQQRNGKREHCNNWIIGKLVIIKFLYYKFVIVNILAFLL